jgi:regulator of protease activity HflC (stomatin/prohibitin superfamily)
MEIFLAFLLGASVIGLSGIRVIREYKRSVIFRLGRQKSLSGPGIYYLIPFIDSQNVVDVRTQTVDIAQQETITKDSVTVKINAVLWYRIADPEYAIVRVADYREAVYQVAQTALRNVIGQHVLDEVLKERDRINAQIEDIVDSATAPWGIKVEMVEMKDVEIPQSLQRAMAREAEAVREKRARIIKAEAEMEASQKLTQASEMISSSPAALELRRMQMLSEIGAENNTTTIVMLPSEFMSLAKNLSDSLSKPSSSV